MPFLGVQSSISAANSITSDSGIVDRKASLIRTHADAAFEVILDSRIGGCYGKAESRYLFTYDGQDEEIACDSIC